MISRKTTVSAAVLLLASASAAAAFPATATTDLNVRSGPGTGYSVVDQLQEGQTVEVIARSGGWYQLDGGGWASGNYLDGESSTVGYAEPEYGYDYGPAAFYYGSDPYYWDNAGFYFYIRDGRRHRIGWDWFDRHDHRRFKWSDNRFRHDFERRRDGDRSARRNIRNEERGERNFRRSESDEGNVRFQDRNVQSGRSSAIESEGRSEFNRGGFEGRGRGEGNLRASGNRSGGDGGQRRLEENIPGGGY